MRKVVTYLNSAGGASRIVDTRSGSARRPAAAILGLFGVFSASGMTDRLAQAPWGSAGAVPAGAAWGSRMIDVVGPRAAVVELLAVARGDVTSRIGFESLVGTWAACLGSVAAAAAVVLVLVGITLVVVVAHAELTSRTGFEPLVGVTMGAVLAAGSGDEAESSNE